MYNCKYFGLNENITLYLYNGVKAKAYMKIFGFGDTSRKGERLKILCIRYNVTKLER